MSVNPKVIEKTPFIAGVAMNGIEVKAKARITVRANIARDLLVVLVKKQSLPSIAYLQLVLVSIIQKCSRIQTIFQNSTK